MIRSMTGFGRASFAVADLGFDIEVRTVNHRYLDIRVKLPRVVGEHEGSVKAQVQEALSRGKVDLVVSVSGGGASTARLEIDLPVAEEYLRAARDLQQGHDVGGALDVTALLSLPGVARFIDPELPEAEVQRSLAPAVEAALAAVDAMRAREGEALAAELTSRLDHVRELVTGLGARTGLVLEAAKERLKKRSEQLRQETGLLDEARLHQEIVIAADRMDITEELVRLRSHVDQFDAIVKGGEAGKPVGRRLDFLLQEMGREANTIGSKASDAPIAHDVVELKTELERIREQVQNVE